MVRSPQFLPLVATLTVTVAASIGAPRPAAAVAVELPEGVVSGGTTFSWSLSDDLVARTRAARADRLPFRRLRHVRLAATVPVTPAAPHRPGIASSLPADVEFEEIPIIADFGGGAPEAPEDTLAKAVLRPRPWLFVDRTPAGRVILRLGVRDADRGATAVLRLFDVQGRRVATLWSGTLGDDLSLEWNGRDEAGRSVPRGVYFARAAFGTTVLRGRLVLAHR